MDKADRQPKAAFAEATFAQAARNFVLVENNIAS